MLRPALTRLLWAGFAGLMLVPAACTPKQVVTAPVNAAGAVVRTAAPVAAGAAVGAATASPRAAVGTGRAVSGVLAAEPAPPADAARAAPRPPGDR